LDLRDPDLISIQEARDLVALAAAAQKKFASFSQEQVDAVVEACAAAGSAAADALARRAVSETGFGNVVDKTAKNRFASENVAQAIRAMRTVGILLEDREKRILEVASPVGVVAAVIPSTNPTSTAIYKTLISVKARNAIVLSPHPAAIRCICETATTLGRAATSAGAPDGLVQCMQHTTLAGTQELMRHPQVGVILATGGTGLVRAAYASGKPAYGVGPGNVPAFIERSADVAKAIADIFAGKTFDYGTICSSEQAIVVEDSARQMALEECRSQGGYFLSSEEAARLGALVFLPGTHAPNTAIVGRPATVIAEMAGITVPTSTRVLIARLEPDRVGREFPLSAEKLSPILAFYAVHDLAAGIELCQRLLRFGGLGHTCAIHSQSDAAIREFGQAVPAFRVCVNTSAVHGSIGYSTNLFPAMTLGCGAPGGNITSDNIGPQHLFNVKRIAWESRPVEHRSVPADRRLESIGAKAPSGVATTGTGAGRPAFIPPADSAAMPPASASPSGLDRTRIAKTVERVLSERGLVRASDLAQAHAPEPPPASQIAAEIVGRLFRSAPEQAPSAPQPPPPAADVAVPPVEVVPFVSEADVQRARARGEKIYIGPKTIVTPSARDMGVEHNVFVETEGSAKR
jgi:acetaldehyde dehydrogenase (acetylating)